MNVYEKLQQCRVELQDSGVKKSGQNKFAGYSYYELGDFMPRVNLLFNKHKLFSQVSFDSEVATLTIANSEQPDEFIRFTTPMAEASLKGCHGIQNLGAVITYQRRYLYMLALEIVEQDALDGAEPVKQSPPAETPNKKSEYITEKQAARLFGLAGYEKGNNDAVELAKEIVQGILTEKGVATTKEIKKADYDAICEQAELALADKLV